MPKEWTERLQKWDREHMVHSRWPIGSNNGVVFNKSYGIYLQDTEGKEYIDSGSQLICVNLGYGNRELIEAIKDGIDKLQFGMLFFGFSNELYLMQT